MQTWMADALLGARPQRRHATPTNVLDADSAWTHLLGHYLGLPSGRPDVETIILWSMEPETTGRFAALPVPLAEAVRARLAESAGGLGALLAAGLAAGHSRELLPIGLVCDLLFDGEPESNPPDPVLVQAAARLEPLLGGTSVEPARGRDWGIAARAVLGALRGDRRGEWLDRAESLLASLKAEAFSDRSSVLPLRVREPTRPVRRGGDGSDHERELGGARIRGSGISARPGACRLRRAGGTNPPSGDGHASDAQPSSTGRSAEGPARHDGAPRPRRRV